MPPSSRRGSGGIFSLQLETSHPPVTYSAEDLLKRVRRTNSSSAGGLSGSNYKTMQAWFVAADTLAEQLTELFNRIAAGQVPASIVPFLTAGRGLVIPNQEAQGSAQWLWEAPFCVLLEPSP